MRRAGHAPELRGVIPGLFLSGLPDRSAVNCSQIATIQQSGPESRLRPPRGEPETRPIGKLSADKMALVDEALRFNLALR